AAESGAAATTASAAAANTVVFMVILRMCRLFRVYLVRRVGDGMNIGPQTAAFNTRRRENTLTEPCKLARVDTLPGGS
ncbi:MAG: hypothetical protein AAF848_12315, partial [Pseudomonadota bacterium]